jgi:hypothetical protein
MMVSSAASLLDDPVVAVVAGATGVPLFACVGGRSSDLTRGFAAGVDREDDRVADREDDRVVDRAATGGGRELSSSCAGCR